MMDGRYNDYTDMIKQAFKTAGEILNSTGEQMLNPTPTVREECEVIHKYTWKDIVKIGDKVFCEEFPISGDTDGDGEYYTISSAKYSTLCSASAGREISISVKGENGRCMDHISTPYFSARVRARS